MNFEFLKQSDDYYDLFSDAAIEAEKVFATSKAMCAIGCRKALELSVRWVYSIDNTIEEPYKDNLQTLLHETSFRYAVDSRVWPQLKFVVELGNQAVHTKKRISSKEAMQALKILFLFIDWIDYTYGPNYQQRTFNPEKIPAIKLTLNTKTIKEQESLLEEKENRIQDLEKKLQAISTQVTASKENNQNQRTFNPNEISKTEKRSTKSLKNTLLSPPPIHLLPNVNAHDETIEVTLPSWLDTFIFDNIGASYCPSGKKKEFDNNLNSSKEDLLIYLGTYFPRSFAETYVIFDSLFSCKHYLNQLPQSKPLKICSVGTGTGGDILGLISAIRTRFPTCPRIEITSIEGNRDAHVIAKQAVEESARCLNMQVTLNLIDYTFEAPKPFETFREACPDFEETFHFIISSKMLNELDHTQISSDPYFEFCEFFVNLLNQTGILMALDIASKNGASNQWTPERLNNQVNSFLKLNKTFKTIVPLLCNRLEEYCEGSCYTKNTIQVSHSRKSNDCSNITYRAIGTKELADALSILPDLWNCPIAKHNEKDCKGF